MFEKIHVKGKKQHQLYKWLSDKKQNGWNDQPPTWNFCKYLIDNNGDLMDYYKSHVIPLDSSITKYLGQINERQKN